MNLNLTKEQQLLLLGLIASIVVGLGVMVYRGYSAGSSQRIIIEETKNTGFTAPASTIMVHVCGAVRREGVYKISPGDRLLDALKMAGGSLPSADLSALNLAEIIKDGIKIVVPAKQIMVEMASKTGSSRVNINTADEKALDSLPGVGPSMAKAILEYRRTNGPFARIEQIMEIPKFGKSKFEKIKDKIVI